MDDNLIFEAKKFLVHYLKGQTCRYEQIHPWRKPWEFVVLHSLRVESYVKKLLDLERHGLSSEEVTLVRLAAVLHDVGRIHQRPQHAEIGRGIVSDWLSSNPILHAQITEVDRLLNMIGCHSDKEQIDEDFAVKILKDADVLDEIGIISIFMASNWIDRGDPYYFAKLKDRVQSKEVSFCDEGMELLQTESAKKLLLQKRAFIVQFCSQLAEELDGTEQFGKILLEDCFI